MHRFAADGVLTPHGAECVAADGGLACHRVEERVTAMVNACDSPPLMVKACDSPPLIVNR